MRAAPPVQVVCAGGAVWRVVQIVLPAVAAAVFFVWVMLHFELNWAWAPAAVSLAAVLLALGAGWASWNSLPATPLHLTWDSQTWQLNGVAGDLRVMLHLGSWLLLRHQPQGISAKWLAVGRADTGAAHPVFCAAVYCRATPSTPAGSPRQPS